MDYRKDPGSENGKISHRIIEYSKNNQMKIKMHLSEVPHSSIFQGVRLVAVCIVQY